LILDSQISEYLLAWQALGAEDFNGDVPSPL
jgi:hypothetical protein